MGPGARRRVAESLVSLVLALSVLTPGVQGSDEDYLRVLSMQLDAVQVHLGAAGRAIGECNSDLIGCLQSPEGTIQRVDLAAEGLRGIVSNLSAIASPSRFAASHQLLIQGLGKIIDGFSLYSSGVRGRDANKISAAGDLVQSGKEDVQTATSVILADPGQGSLLIILGIAVVAVGASVAVLSIYFIRTTVADRKSRLGSEVATCPKCGEVLDQWWTFRAKEVRHWREDHMRVHTEDLEGAAVHNRKA